MVYRLSSQFIPTLHGLGVDLLFCSGMWFCEEDQWSDKDFIIK